MYTENQELLDLRFLECAECGIIFDNFDSATFDAVVKKLEVEYGEEAAEYAVESFTGDRRFGDPATCHACAEVEMREIINEWWTYI